MRITNRDQLKLRFAFLLISVLALGACGVLDFSEDKHISSSLVNYLYSDGNELKKSQEGEIVKQIPHIELPVRVGIAFVPSNSSYSNIDFNPVQQLELLEKAKSQFSEYEFIEHIELIPANYLQSRGGFTNLKQVANLYNVDLMALVSYDQVQTSYSKDSAFMYLTVVGAYVIKGDDNHTQSFVDPAVFDVKTNSLLFRAPGIHKARKNSTLNDRELIQDKMSKHSFNQAMRQMLINLDQELKVFTERVKNEKVATLSYKSSFSGGGKIDLVFLLILLVMLGLRVRKKPC